jgi:hypothetical protein
MLIQKIFFEYPLIILIRFEKIFPETNLEMERI